MSKTPTFPTGYTKSLPLDVPLGHVYVTKEAMELLFQSNINLDNVLKWHATGYGGDCDHDYGCDNYELAEIGGLNASLHDLDIEDDLGEPMQLRVETPSSRRVTIVSIHTEAE